MKATRPSRLAMTTAMRPGISAIATRRHRLGSTSVRLNATLQPWEQIVKRERKVHYYGDNGDVTGTLCFTGANVPRSKAHALLVTNHPGSVTCRICEFQLLVQSEIASIKRMLPT